MPSAKPSLPPPSLMTWTVNDPLIEDLDVLEREFHDIRTAGFRGVAVWVRCSRYSWNDALTRRALRRIGELCEQHSIEYWLGPDPRFVSHELNRGGRGLEVVAFGDRTRADVFPHFARIVDRAFSLRCETPARHVHMLRDVAIEYYPLGILRAYAVPASQESFSDEEVVDITDESNFFYHALDRYVEAFGRFDPPDAREWNVIAFFRFATNHVDFSDAKQMRRYAKMLHRLKNNGVEANGMLWDEPGYTCTYGTVPYSKVIRKTFKKRMGRSLKKNLWKLALDTSDGSHVDVRNGYYRVIQDQLNNAQFEANKHAAGIWGSDVAAGIHDTWHFESGDMCDMNHGSLDLWRALPTKSGGFVDVGGVNDLRDPGSGYYANLAALSAICASLGRWSDRRFAMNNLWTIGDDEGEGWQRTVMEHCVYTMALFGTRWLAHAYGPVGTIGEERSFLGSPPLPGYPDHSTWPGFPEWNQLLEEHFAIVEDSIPVADVLVVFPIETLYALADTRADQVALDVFNLILALVDAHFHVEVLSSALVSREGYGDRHPGLEPNRHPGLDPNRHPGLAPNRHPGLAPNRHPGLDPGSIWKNGQLRIADHSYDAVVYPHPKVVGREMLPLLDDGTGQIRRDRRPQESRPRDRRPRESGDPHSHGDLGAVWIPGQARDDSFEVPDDSSAGPGLLYVFGAPERTDHNDVVSLTATDVASGSAEVIEWLESRDLSCKLEAPSSSWASVSLVERGAVVTLAPARHGLTYAGCVTFAGRSIDLEERKGLTHILFPEDGNPELITRRRSSRK